MPVPDRLNTNENEYKKCNEVTKEEETIFFKKKKTPKITTQKTHRGRR